MLGLFEGAGDMGKFHLILIMLVLLPVAFSIELTSNLQDLNTSLDSISITWTATNGSENTTNLAAYYKFDISNANQYDSSGNNRNLTAFGATWNESGKYSGTYNYDGINDYMSVSGLVLGSRTLMAWIKNTKNAQGQIMGYDTYRGEINYDDSYPRLIYSHKNVNQIFSVNLDGWNHIAVTVDGVNIFLYVNGAYVGNKTAASASADPTGFNFTIGSRGGTSIFWNGSIDDARIYSYALAWSEIQEIYNSGKKARAIACNLTRDGTTIDSVSPYSWDTSDYFEEQYQMNLTCFDGLNFAYDSGLYRFHYYTDTYYAAQSLEELEDINEVLDLIPFVLLWLGMWALGYYAVQTGNTLLGGTMIVLTVPLDLFFSYRFQESMMLGTGFLGVAFAILCAWTFGMLVLIKRKVPG